MKGIYRSNQDLDIILSKENIDNMQHKSEITKYERGFFSVKHEDPVLESELFDETDKKVGVIKLQQIVENNLICEYGLEFLKTIMNRGVFFIKMGPEWDIKLDWQAYLELRNEGTLTRRIPIINSQIWIYNPEH